MLQQRVEAGIAWLDEEYPGWRTRIDLEDLGLCSKGILGLLFGHSMTAVERFGLHEAFRLGFDQECGK